MDDRADDTILVLETDGITLVEIDLHVATLITGNTALVTTVVVDKDVPTLVGVANGKIRDSPRRRDPS